MNHDLITRLREIKDRAHDFVTEEATKQWAILPILECLGWDPKAIGEIIPEYPIGGGKVDYCLKHSGQEKCFVEAKNPGRDLHNSQEQLLKYVFQAKADVAVLTNGITWWFYLPHEAGKWEEKRFFVVDLEGQETEKAAEHLEEFLGKSALLSGEATERAQELLRSREKDRLVLRALPQAWQQLLTGRDERLRNLLAETTEKICGHRPDKDKIDKFLKGVADGGTRPPPGRTIEDRISDAPRGDATANYTNRRPVAFCSEGSSCAGSVLERVSCESGGRAV